MKLLLLQSMLVLCLFASAQQTSTEPLHQKTLVLRRFLEQNHYKPIQWNDAAATMLYNRWMKILDDDKIIFTKTEIAQLSPYSTTIDEELTGKGWGFFNKSLQLYKLGLTRADSNIKAILSKPLDFSKPDILSWPLADYAANNPEAYIRWQKYLKWKVLHSITDLSMDSSKQPASNPQQPANFSALEIKARAQVKKQELSTIQSKLTSLVSSAKELEDEYLAAITWCYDPHTEYMNADAKNDFDTEMSGLEFSIGFEMDENDKGEWAITYLVPGGPAWRNGELHKGDVIIKMKAGDKPALELADASIGELSKIFSGSSNEKIAVTVRTLSGQQKTAVLGKEKITNEEGIVKSYLLHGAKKIGYITLPGFYVKEGDEEKGNGCANDVAKEVMKLKKDSIEGLILDLRYNGGGSLGEALELAGIFINEGPLTSTKDKAGKVHFLKDPNRGTIYDGPMLVMVNTMSASASELVTAVLQDYHRALIVGSPTYGKGTEQLILPMDTTGNFSTTKKYDSYVKVTDGKFYRVDGTTTQWKGVVPDIGLPDMYAMDKLREKGTISALQPDNSKVAIYDALPPILFAALKIKSNERVNADADFKAIVKFAAWYKSMDGIKNIPLQWAGYSNYYKEIKSMYSLVEDKKNRAANNLVASNNSLDSERQQVITEQSKAINEVNIKRLQKDGYIAECYKIMQDWLQ